ncbi:hypothetical protein TRICI_003918 [Trichomonascus ciferrii]|uniref:Uncharacterized protein n=1 Tax=Trichomonascus ciferrii TaxID=44093 RepID=A0A642V2J2_9ASCO|nr:hypothetical protein TRICI_003918 [Trichomonascus ciferrii]
MVTQTKYHDILNGRLLNLTLDYKTPRKGLRDLHHGLSIACRCLSNRMPTVILGSNKLDVSALKGKVFFSGEFKDKPNEFGFLLVMPESGVDICRNTGELLRVDEE